MRIQIAALSRAVPFFGFAEAALRRRYLLLLIGLSGLTGTSSDAQTFSGTNAAGKGSNFTFTLGAGATNLSLVVSNNATAYSWLFLQNGGTPTTNNYQFTSRLAGLTNQINLEQPQFVTGSYGLLVFTPSNSTAQSFNVTLTSNRTDLRAANYPVSKPLVFSTTGSLTNSGVGAWQYFQVDVPSNLLTGWRVVVSSTNATPPGLYIRRGQLPTASSYDYISAGYSVETVTLTTNLATAATYFIGVYLPSGPASSANYTLGAELASVTTLTWDPGTTQAGNQVYNNQSTTGGDYFFGITTATTADGVWRNALNVQSGQASLYLVQGAMPATNYYSYASTQAGSNGFVLSQGQQFSPGQNWYLLVHGTPGAQWNLVSGEAYVYQLPALAADASSSSNVTMGAEGMAFFKTTISSNTLAWQLGLNGLTNQVLVKTLLAPVPLNTSTYDLTQPGQMLVVPAYLNIGSQYFVGVVGRPGLNFTLDSRQQPVTTIPFNYTTNFSVSTYGYATFLVQVPVQQIAWQINVTPTAGDAFVAVNLDAVPNEFVNLAYSEAPSGLGDSITLVPPTLTDGSFYVTVYGTPPYTCTLFNGNPVITTVDYLFSITNDAPERVGWRFYQVLNTNNEQIDSLGWELDLSNAPAGAEIAIRRNAVPGAWNYRNDPYDYYGYNTTSYSDLSSTLGFLQQPNHPADVWYIGVYSPFSALGNFVLTGSNLVGAPVGFDGASGVTNIIGQPAGKWDYFIVTVPSNAFGWDLRLTNVTSGDPHLYVCRDQLPAFNNPYYWTPQWSSSWPSGYQWAPYSDWTGEAYDPNGQYESGWVLAMGMGNPLQAGTYYVGVVNTSGSTPMSYSLASRGIGTGFSIPVNPLAFSNGVVASTLAARQAAYYSVVVPTNLPSWRVELDTNMGDAMLVIQENALPNSQPGGYPPYQLLGGFAMNKVGDEQYLMMPINGQTNIVAGTYYLAVVSQGTNSNPPYSVIGGGSSSYTLGSYGSLNLTNLGTLNPTGSPDLLETNGLSLAGQICAYTFTVPSNTLGLEVFLTNTTGSPNMTLLTGNQLPSAQDGYGVTGGQSYTWVNSSLINIPGPAATNYTLLVQAEQAGGDASYVVRVHAIGPQPVAFDAPGNTWAITNQPAGIWQYFIINVPSNALGWDLRLTNVTCNNNSQRPQMYVCRDTAPSLNNPYYWTPQWNSSWPSGYQWAPYGDWTGEEYDPDGQYESGWVLAMGMGNPLQAGTYYVGVINNNTGTNLISYTLASRGIGTGFSIPVTPLPSFANGVVTNLGLAARQAAYYSLFVPTNTPSWRVELDTNMGDAMLVIQENALPNSEPGGYPPYQLLGGFTMNKVGDEQYLMMPINGQTNIVAGTYYLAVVSQGTNSNPPYSVIGGGSSSYVLGSYGSLVVTNIGTASGTGPDLLETNGLSLAGQICAYSFTVNSNILALEIFLTNTAGSPYMTLLTGNQLPSVQDSYGVTGGQGYTWYNSSLINIPNPVATTYTLMVQAEQAGGNASYTVQVHAIGPQPVAFDGTGNTWAITNQGAGLWQYFIINVPSNGFSPIVNLPTPVLGWDLRLTNVTYNNNQRPQMYVCRDTAPSLNNPYSWNPQYSSSWPSGYQWAPYGDWTAMEYDPDGQYEGGWVLAMGMGNPLQPGTYYVGVINNATGTNLISYTLASRGIGPNFSIPVTPLAFTNGVITNTAALNPRQADYYSVVVPTNIPNWKVRLTDVSGETALVIQENALPNSEPSGYPVYDLYGGYEMNKPGNEQYLLLPVNAVSYSNTVVAGTYYLAVVGQGQNPNFSYGILGTNSSFYSLESFGVQGITNLGVVSATDILQTNAIQGGENALYQFTIPPGLLAVEVRLDNVTASPYMTLQTGSNVVYPEDNYGYNGGVVPSWYSPTLITLPNPSATNYSLTVQASYNNTVGAYEDADFTVHIREMPAPPVAFDPSLNSATLSNTASGTLLDGESAFYQVIVPATINGQPVIGWTLTLSQTLGTPSVRVRPGLLPDGYNYYDGTSPFNTGEAIIVPPYLTPGVWYVEVRASGATDYTLTSAALQLKRPAWTMQPVGGAVTTPGLSAPLFADTGVDTNGNALPGDQGTNLAQANFDYYEIIVPANNTGVLRTRLDAISGNPNLYLRAGGAPTLSHNLYGQGGALYDRSLTASGGSEYGNWVPLNGRFQPVLTPGAWYLAVQASGNSNVRYRLRLDTGSISNLSLNAGSYTNQSLVAGDWLYYSAFIPTNAPVDWNVTFAVQRGNVVMYVRDTSPPGQATSITDLRDWNSDYKNHGPYPNFPSPGSYTLTTPPLRPGNTYFLGFEATLDSVFSVSCTTNGGYINFTNTIAFYNGYVSNTLPAFGLLNFRVDVPPGADRWIHFSTNSSAVYLYLDQGSAPTMTTSDDWYSYGNTALNEYLQNPSYWPWQPGYSYFLAVTNTSASTQPFIFILNGEGPGGPSSEFTSFQYLPNDTFQMTMQVTPGWTYALETSTDLINWSVLTTFTPTTSIYSYIDYYAPGYPSRFYRLTEQ